MYVRIDLGPAWTEWLMKYAWLNKKQSKAKPSKAKERIGDTQQKPSQAEQISTHQKAKQNQGKIKAIATTRGHKPYYSYFIYTRQHSQQGNVVTGVVVKGTAGAGARTNQ